MSEIEKANKVEAHRRAELIRMGMVTYAQTLETIAEAFAARDWVTLGYESWDIYVDKEFAEKRLKLDTSRRREAAEALRLTGMSTRAIGSALGVHQETVVNDLKVNGIRSPEMVIGADGKRYAPTRPEPEPAVDPVPAAIAEQIEERIAEKTVSREEQPEEEPARTEQSDDARRDAELDAAMADTTVRFRRNLSAAVARADDVWSFDVDRIAEVYAGDWETELRPFLTEMTRWCERVTQTCQRKRSGLRVVNGGRP